MNKNEVHNISLPANFHHGQAYNPLALSHTPSQLVAVEISPTTGMARHSKMPMTRKISLIMRNIRFTGSKFTRERDNLFVFKKLLLLPESPGLLDKVGEFEYDTFMKYSQAIMKVIEQE